MPPVVDGGFHETVTDVNDVGTTAVIVGVPGACVGDPDVYAYPPTIVPFVSAATLKYAVAPTGRPVTVKEFTLSAIDPLSVHEIPSWLC